MSDNYRMYKQAYETLQENYVESFDVINPFNKRVDKSGLCPTLTTRPEGFKTCILIAVPNNAEPSFTVGGCVDCDECNHRSEDCLCDISDNDENCPLLTEWRD